jgi:hypothetical protein
MDNIDNYAHRLSVKNSICYESAHNIIKESINRLNNTHYESNDIIRSAYKYSRHKLNKQEGGYNNTVPLILNKKYH